MKKEIKIKKAWAIIDRVKEKIENMKTCSCVDGGSCGACIDSITTKNKILDDVLNLLTELKK
jgi:hypothetical protein